MMKYLYLTMLLLFSMSGCSQKGTASIDNENFSELRSYVKKFDDINKSTQILTLINTMEHNILSLHIASNTFIKQSRTQISDFNTDDKALTDVHHVWIQERDKLENSLIDVHFAMKSMVSPTDWTEMVRLQKLGYKQLETNMRIN